MRPFSPASLYSRQDNGFIDPNPANNITVRLNSALSSSGAGYILRLCPNTQYMIQALILLAPPNQEIRTGGYPTGSSRATLVVNGQIANRKGHTTAVDGTCSICFGVTLHNIQVSPSHFVSRSADFLICV